MPTFPASFLFLFLLCFHDINTGCLTHHRQKPAVETSVGLEGASWIGGLLITRYFQYCELRASTDTGLYLRHIAMSAAGLSKVSNGCF